MTDSKERLAKVVADLGSRKIVVVSNREPVVHDKQPDGTVRVLHPASGMTTALVPVVEACGGAWVAHGSGSADFDVVDERNGLAWRTEEGDYRIRRVQLSREVEAGYYYGLANEGIWPLCHNAYHVPPRGLGDVPVRQPRICGRGARRGRRRASRGVRPGLPPRALAAHAARGPPAPVFFTTTKRSAYSPIAPQRATTRPSRSSRRPTLSADTR